MLAHTCEHLSGMLHLFVCLCFSPKKNTHVCANRRRGASEEAVVVLNMNFRSRFLLRKEQEEVCAGILIAAAKRSREWAKSHPSCWWECFNCHASHYIKQGCEILRPCMLKLQLSAIKIIVEVCFVSLELHLIIWHANCVKCGEVFVQTYVIFTKYLIITGPMV